MTRHRYSLMFLNGTLKWCRKNPLAIFDDDRGYQDHLQRRTRGVDKEEAMMK